MPSDEDGDRNVQRTLGNIEGAIREQSRLLERIDRDAVARDVRAEEQRRALAAEVSSIKTQLGERMTMLEGRMANQELIGIDHGNKLTMAMPMVEEWRQLREQGRGALKLGRILYLMLATIAAGVGAIVGLVWRYLDKLPPHH